MKSRYSSRILTARRILELIYLKKLVRSTVYEQQEANLDSSSNKISPVSDANKALVRLALTRCNCSSGGSPDVVVILDDASKLTVNDELCICVYLATAFLTGHKQEVASLHIALER